MAGGGKGGPALPVASTESTGSYDTKEGAARAYDAAARARGCGEGKR
jgi:hypothetical protein